MTSTVRKKLGNQRTFSKTLKMLLVLISIGIFSFQNAKATHIMGGDLTYKWLGDSTYEVTFLIYRDCDQTASIDDEITYWVYDKKSKNIFINNRTVKLSPRGKQSVEPEAPNCISPNGLCIESGEYIDTVTLGHAPNGYIVTWFRNERNHTIDNLKRCQNSTNNSSCSYYVGFPWNRRCNSNDLNPFGMVWTAEIPSYKYQNSSPQFLTVPVPFFCVGQNNSFNHTVYDPDGDSLVFKVVDPLSPEVCSDIIPTPSSTQAAPSYTDAHKTVTYQSGYSRAKPFGSSSSSISINSSTGEMRARPLSAGNYVIAVEIEEYRVDPITNKSTYLGSIRRDLQFIAGSCPNSVNSPPSFTKTGQSSMDVDVGDTIKFEIAAKDNSDTIYLQANGSIFGGIAANSIKAPFATFRDTQGFKTASQEFFWVPTCDHVTYTTPHVFTVLLSDEGCNQYQRTYSINVNGEDIYKPSPINCLDIVGTNLITVSWDSLENVPDFDALHIYRRDGNGRIQKMRTFRDSTVTSWTDSSANNAQSSFYSYYSRIENICGLEGRKSDSLSTIQLNYTELSDKSIRLNWNDYHTDSTSYIVQKLIGSSYVNLDTTDFNTYDHQSCELQTQFRVVSLDTSGFYCSISSNSVTPSTQDNTPPTGAPSIAVASAISSNANEIEFGKSSNNEVTSYKLLRSSNGAAYRLVDSISSINSSIKIEDDNNVNNTATNYCYLVSSVDSCGNTGDTSLQRHCLVNLKVRAGQRASKLNWNSYVGFSVDSHLVERFDTTSKSWKVIARLDDQTRFYKDTSSILCGFVYSYRIKTKQDGGNFSVSLSDSESVRAKDTIGPNSVDFLNVSNNDDTSSVIHFLSSTSSDVSQYLVLVLEYNGGTLVNTDINQIAAQNSDTLSVVVKTPNAKSRQYCFRVLASDSCGNNFSSNDETHCLPFLSGNARNKEVRLNWTSYSGFEVDSYYVEVLDSSQWNQLAQLQSTSGSFTHKNLACNVDKTYRLRIEEKNGNNSIVYSNEITVTPFDTINPNAPDLHFATVENDSVIELEWTHSLATDVTKYEIRSSQNGGNFSVLSTENKNTQTVQSFRHVSSAIKNDTFSYRVVAIDSCSVDNRSVNNETHRAIQLKGNPANQSNEIYWSEYEGFSVKEYKVQSFDKTNNSWSVLSTLPSSQSSFTHTNLFCFDTLTYRIAAVDDNNNFESFSDTIRLKPFDTISPEPPVIRSINASQNNRIVISWNKSSSQDVNRYILFRQSENGSRRVVDTLDGDLSYTDQINNIDSVWSYQLKAIDSCAENTSFKFSKTASNIRLRGESIGCDNQMQLSWNDYTGFEQGLSHYDVYRSVDSGPFVAVGRVTASATSYSEMVSQHHDYEFQIHAVENNSGIESISNVLDFQQYITHVPAIRTASIIESDANNGQIKISWPAQTGNDFVEYSKLYYRPSGSASFSLLEDQISLSQDSFVHSGLNTKTQTHEYFLVNQDSCGNISDTQSIHTTMDMEFDYGQLVHNLKWTPYSGFNIQEYRLQQLVGGNYIDVDTISASSNKFDRVPAPCNTLITYRIAAVDFNGNQAYSDTTSGLAIDVLPPDAPSLLNISAVNDTAFEVQFRGNDSLDTYGFSVQKRRNQAAFFEDGVVLFTTPQQNAIYTDTVSNIDLGYFAYRIVALDSCLNTAVSDTFRAINLMGTAGNYESHLAWRPFKGYPIDNYEIEMNSGGFWQGVGTVSANDTDFTHGPVGCNSPVSYRVIGIEDNGNRRTQSNFIQVTPFDTIAPDKPQMISASVIDSQLIELSWEFDINSDIKTYRIYKEQASGTFSIVDSVNRQNSYLDTVLNSTDSIYRYYVEAIDSCNATRYSPPSDTNTTFTFKIAKDSCDPTTYINWTAADGLKGNIDQYHVYRAIAGQGFNVIDTVPMGSLSFEDSNIVAGTTYIYRLAAHNSTEGISAYTDTLKILQDVRPQTQPPVFISSSVRETGTSNGEIELQWNKLSKSEEPFLKGYRVWRADTTGIAPTLIGDLNTREDTTFIYNGNTANDYHYFRITAYNTCGVDGDTSGLHAPIQLNVENLNLASILKWSNYIGFEMDEYHIFSEINGNGFNQIATVDGQTYEYTDITVGCGESISFKVEGISENGIKTSSDFEQVIGFDTTLPEPVALRQVGFDDGNILNASWNNSSSADAEYYTLLYKLNTVSKWDTLADNINGTSYSQNNFPYQGINPYEFRVITTDSCGNTQFRNTPAHHYVALEAETNESKVQLRWRNYRGWAVDSFLVFRDNQLIAVQNIDSADFDSLFTAVDSNIGCDTTIYNYYVRAKGKAGQISESNRDTAVGIDANSPLATYLRSASVLPSNKGVRLSWNKSFQSDIKSYLIYRKDQPDGEFSQVGFADANSTSAIDSVDVNSEFCYQIRVLDNCDNIGNPSNLGCIVHLKGGHLNQANSLRWNPYKNWNDSIESYEIYRSEDTSNWYLIDEVEDRIKTFVDTFLNDSVLTYCYRVKAREQDAINGESVWSSVMCATQEPLTYIPNSFTPSSSQGLNDGFGPQGAFVPKDYSMRIFNRWGQLIYSTDSGEEWQGNTLRGEKVMMGEYFYLIEFTTENDEQYKFTGNVTVIR